jgi:DNA (cytosine-5)-methyltransferase 1
MMTNKKLKMIDLFAGLGGIRLGFEKASDNLIETVFVSEIDKKACETYGANHGDQPSGDLTKIVESDIPAFDILGGGFPCQSFSIAGKRLGFEDTRGTLFFDVARIIKHHQPSVVFLENVKGLTNHDKGQTFKIIINSLEELGYTVFWKILNAKNYGLPQKRERIYIIAFNKEKVTNAEAFVFPEHSPVEPTINSILEKNVDLRCFISNQYWDTLKKHKARHAKKGNGFGYEIIKKNNIANTIVVGGMGRERNLVIDKSKPTNKENIKKDINSENVRMMTVREWARLQGYPDSFIFPVSNSSAYKQLGNSVAVNVIEAIAKEILKIIKKP